MIHLLKDIFQYLTVRHRLFGNSGPCRYLHIIWNQEITDKERRSKILWQRIFK